MQCICQDRKARNRTGEHPFTEICGFSCEVDMSSGACAGAETAFQRSSTRRLTFWESSPGSKASGGRECSLLGGSRGLGPRWSSELRRASYRKGFPCTTTSAFLRWNLWMPGLISTSGAAMRVPRDLLHSELPLHFLTGCPPSRPSSGLFILQMMFPEHLLLPASAQDAGVRNRLGSAPWITESL